MDVINKIYKDAATYHGDEHNEDEIIHKYNDAKPTYTRRGGGKDGLYDFFSVNPNTGKHMVSN